jgi:hypothetical protein
MTISDTPIYDALVLERALADQEGLGLVAAIHERQRARLLAMDRVERQVQAAARPRTLDVLFPFVAGMFR